MLRNALQAKDEEYRGGYTGREDIRGLGGGGRGRVVVRCRLGGEIGTEARVGVDDDFDGSGF